MNCSICGKEITTSVSVKRGIGPLCYEKLKREEMVAISEMLPVQL